MAKMKKNDKAPKEKGKSKPMPMNDAGGMGKTGANGKVVGEKDGKRG